MICDALDILKFEAVRLTEFLSFFGVEFFEEHGFWPSAEVKLTKFIAIIKPAVDD